MGPLTKLVSGRLKAQPTLGPHPDAALLSAFAENTLPQSDRGPLLQHLGACSDCREILFLALPESVEAQKVLILKPSWFRRWGLTWGAAVAAVAIAAVVLNTTHLGRKDQSLKTAVTAAPAAENKIAAEATPPELDQMQAARDASARKKTAAVAENEPRPQPEAKHMTGKMQAPLVFDRSGEVHVQSPAQSANAVGALASGARDKEKEGEKDEKQKENSAAVGIAIADSGSAGKPTDSAYATTEAGRSRADEPAASGQQAVVSGADSSAPAAPIANVPPSSEVIEVEAAAPLVENQTSSASMSKVEKLGVTGRNFAAVLPKWSLSAAGGVQRSLDHGKTWLPAQPVAGVVFRAVASVGQEVWAAGNGGALYHSADAGLAWARLTVKEDGKAVQDDFTGIDFTDAAHGRLKASGGAELTTSDGGQTWVLDKASQVAH